jgi:bis(5'-nucleosidyl)-tetraphosphatase
MVTVESFGVVPFRQDAGVWQVLLILHKQGNHWGFPKGKANPGETPLQSASRELKEEVGLEISELLSPVPVMERYQFRHKREKIFKIVQYFPALVRGELHLQEEEIRDAKWLPFNEALDRLSFKEARHVLRECVRIADLRK